MSEKFPDDVMETARIVAHNAGCEFAATLPVHIARAIMAERERCDQRCDRIAARLGAIAAAIRGTDA